MNIKTSSFLLISLCRTKSAFGFSDSGLEELLFTLNLDGIKLNICFNKSRFNPVLFDIAMIGTITLLETLDLIFIISSNDVTFYGCFLTALSFLCILFRFSWKTSLGAISTLVNTMINGISLIIQTNICSIVILGIPILAPTSTKH